MTTIQYLSAFRVYSADVLLLALGVTLVTSLLKKTVLKNLSKRVYVFLPFLLGLLFFSVYRAILLKSAAPFTRELTKTLEGGFATGCAATLYYVVYKQFLRGGTPLPPVAGLLSGYVAEQDIATAATALEEGIQTLPKEEWSAFVEKTLNAYFLPGLSPAEKALLTETVLHFLEQLF